MPAVILEGGVSIRALLVGFKYRRTAAEGTSSETGGRRSSVYGTLGSIVRMDRVRKSSGGIEAKLMTEKDLAADRRALSDAVRLDLKADLSGLKGCKNCDLTGWFSGRSNTRKSNSSTSMLSPAKGCSSSVPGGDKTGSSDFRIGLNLRPR